MKQCFEMLYVTNVFNNVKLDKNRVTIRLVTFGLIRFDSVQRVRACNEKTEDSLQLDINLLKNKLFQTRLILD